MSDTATGLARTALEHIKCCSECGYPISKTVQLLVDAGKRFKPGPHTHSCGTCGIGHSDMHRLGSPEDVIVQMISECKLDWWHLKRNDVMGCHIEAARDAAYEKGLREGYEMGITEKDGDEDAKLDR